MLNMYYITHKDICACILQTYYIYIYILIVKNKKFCMIVYKGHLLTGTGSWVSNVYLQATVLFSSF